MHVVVLCITAYVVLQGIAYANGPFKRRRKTKAERLEEQAEENEISNVLIETVDIKEEKIERSF